MEVEAHVQELSKSGSGSESGEGEPETVAETAVEVETLRTALAGWSSLWTGTARMEPAVGR